MTNFIRNKSNKRVPWVIMHVIVDDDFQLYDLVQLAVCTFINLLCCSAAYLVISEIVKISRMWEFATVSDF